MLALIPFVMIRGAHVSALVAGLAFVPLQVLITVVVFWLAHSFAQGIAQRVTAESSVEHGDAMRDLRATWPMVAAAFPLLIPMVLVGLKVFDYDTGLWISYGLAIAILASWGLVIGERRHVGTGARVKLVLASGSLGLFS